MICVENVKYDLLTSMEMDLLNLRRKKPEVESLANPLPPFEDKDPSAR